MALMLWMKVYKLESGAKEEPHFQSGCNLSLYLLNCKIFSSLSKLEKKSCNLLGVTVRNDAASVIFFSDQTQLRGQVHLAEIRLAFQNGF